MSALSGLVLEGSKPSVSRASSVNEASGVLPSRQVADALRADIQSGDLAVGGRVPTARELSETYGVSLTTAIKATDELRRDGLIETRRGRGSVVLSAPALVRHRAQRYKRSNQQLPGTHLSATTSHAEADRRLAARLGVAVGSELSRVDYFWTTSDKRPLQRSTQWEPLALTADTPIEVPDTSGAETVIARFDSIGVYVDHVDEEVRTRMPTSDESAELDIASGTPVFAIQRTHWAGPVAVETADITIRGDRVVIATTHDVPLPTSDS